MNELVLTNAAKQDLSNILLFGIERFGKIQARKYFDGIYRSFDKIVANPLQFPEVIELGRGVRRCVYYSETIYFRYQENQILIIAIVGRQELRNRLF
ncbi:type II toxin-antitoxin system RelE/ParE family toxin [Sanyastnella coralliicola]|uniref:type II toxin-antitoxin system RelE/ParE family toxin n=1 Tax=Sanyastnella coralliicola TaxID=3069118 RepID=UPI00331304AE